MPLKTGLLLTTQEVAKITKLDASHIRTLTHLGKIAIEAKIGSMNFYTRAEVDRFMKVPRRVGKPPGKNYDAKAAARNRRSRAKRKEAAVA